MWDGIIDWFARFAPVLTGMAAITTVVSLVTVYVGVRGYLTTIRQFRAVDSRERRLDRRAQLKDSVALLKEFSEKIIPKIEAAEHLFPLIRRGMEQDNLDIQGRTRLVVLDAHHVVTTNMGRMNEMAKLLAGFGTVFNWLERVSIEINYGLVDEDVVYGPIHHVLVSFIDRNWSVFEQIRTSDNKFENLVNLYYKWHGERRA